MRKWWETQSWFLKHLLNHSSCKTKAWSGRNAVLRWGSQVTLGINCSVQRYFSCLNLPHFLLFSHWFSPRAFHLFSWVSWEGIKVNCSFVSATFSLICFSVPLILPLTKDSHWWHWWLCQAAGNLADWSKQQRAFNTQSYSVNQVVSAVEHLSNV